MEQFIGIDLHTNKFNCCFLDDQGNKEKKAFDFSEESLLEFYSHLDMNTYVMIEASTNSFAFYDLIKSKVLKVIVGNTYKLKLISFVDKKTDIIDAEKLAKYLKMQIRGGEPLVEEVYVPDTSIRNLRSLFATYLLIKKQTASTKNRIHALLKQHMRPFTRGSLAAKYIREKIKTIDLPSFVQAHLALLFNQLDFLEKQAEEVKTVILLEGNAYLKEIDVLTSMNGIGVFMALAFIADIADITRFKSSKKLASYLRSAPGVDQSNEKVINKKTSRYGRRLSISLLSQSYIHFRDSNPKLRRWYDKQSGKKRNGVIRMAIYRRVIGEIFQMLKKGEYHYYRDQKLHDQKMNEYLRLLKKNGRTLTKIA